jgi:hypothetical protein
MGLGKFFETLLHGKTPTPPPLVKEAPVHVKEVPYRGTTVHPHHKALLAHDRSPNRHMPPRSITTPAPDSPKRRINSDEDTDTPSLLTTMVIADALSHDYEPPLTTDTSYDTTSFSGFGGGESGGAGASGSFDSPSSDSSYDSGSSFDSGSSPDSSF